MVRSTNRSVTALGDNLWHNQRNNTVVKNTNEPISVPVPVSEDLGCGQRRKKRQRLDNEEDLDGTVRVLASTFVDLLLPPKKQHKIPPMSYCRMVVFWILNQRTSVANTVLNH